MEEAKYIFTGETMEFEGHTLHQIRAAKNFTNVNTGELGGWIESELNLAQGGECWIYPNAKVYGDAEILEDASIWGSAVIYERAHIFGNAQVYGCVRVHGYARIYDDAIVSDKVELFGHAAIYDNAEVTDNAKIYEDARICGDSYILGDAEVFGNAKLSGNINLKDHAFIRNDQDYLVIGPIGSRDGYTTFYKTKDKRIWVCCGCFNGPIVEFKKRVRQKYRANIFPRNLYFNEYKTTIKLAEISLS